MIAVRLDFDDAEFMKFTRKLGPADIQRAMERAVRYTAAWVRSQTAKSVRGEMDLPRKVIAYRLKQYNKAWRLGMDGGRAVKVWFGIDPLKADKIDTPKKAARGYRVRKWEFQQSFVPKQGRYAGKLMERTTKNRLPLRRSTVTIDEQGEKAFLAISEQIPAKMQEIALKELRYQVFKVLGE